MHDPQIISLTLAASSVFQLVRDKSLPETICCNCIMRINCCLEFQRCIIRNMLNHRIRYYYNIGDRANVVKYQNECKSFQTKCMSLPSGVSESFFNDSSLNRLLRNQGEKSSDFLPDRIANNDSAGLLISDVRTEELPQEPDSTGDEIEEIDSESNVETSATSIELLDPLFHAAESIRDAEALGIASEVVAKPRKKAEPITYECQYCDKVYRRANAWRKHVRSHQVGDQRKVPNQKPKYKCPECSQEFETLTVLRKHSIVHMERFICGTCNEEFRSHYDYSWHAICCEAKNTPSTDADSNRRRTRSQTRSIAAARAKKVSESATDTPTTSRNSKKKTVDAVSVSSRNSMDSTQADSMYNERIEVVKQWAKQLDIGDKPDPKDLTSNNVQDDDCLSIMSDMSGMTRISDISLSTASSLMSVPSILSR